MKKRATAAALFLHSTFFLFHFPKLKAWVATVPPRALRFKRPLHRCNACNPNANAKAELNHRSQVCEALTGTGVRVAERMRLVNISGLLSAGFCAKKIPAKH